MKTSIIQKWKLFYFSIKTLFILTIIVKITQWQLPLLLSVDIKLINSVLLYITGSILSIFQLLSIFQPLKEYPNWSIIFPELNENSKK